MKINLIIFDILATLFPFLTQANSSGEVIKPISEGLQPIVRIKDKPLKLSSPTTRYFRKQG